MDSDAHPAPSPGFAAGFVAGVLDDALAAGATVYGISGLQGTGKSTLAAQLVAAATARGLRAVAVSLDDFYLDLPARQRLARDVHPLLATRGPPGTHEVALACATLDSLREGRPTRLPAFDKLGDRRLPPSQWREAGPVNPGSGPGQALVVFEGWCLGVPAEADEALAAPVNALERDEDADGTWRRWCNAALARDYPALWQRIDRLLFLQPPGFDIVPEWRWQQEQALQARDPSRAGMTRAQLDRFVQHYERVSRQALRTLPAIADTVVTLDADRQPRERPL
ncbi:MAG TPA: kinase [Luteimonas sp.]|nr:kinase [Luteimonas sp.]HRP71885.1 kinase [Luteimonas sp.]